MPDKFIIRTSDRNQFRRCRQKWDFTSKIRMNYEYVPGIEPLEFGTAIHAALEEYYDPVQWPSTAVKRTVAIAAFRRYMKEWRDRQVETNNFGYEQEQRWNELNALGLDMLRGYFDWSHDLDAEWTPVKSEVEFEVPIPGTEYVYQGRIDLIIEDGYGKYWIVDHKTAAQLGSTEHLALDPQTRSYAWAAQQMLGIDVAGVVYNELRKSAPHPPKVLKSGGLSKNKAQLTSKRLYRQTIQELGLNLADYEDFLDSYVESDYFRRTTIAYTAEMLERTQRSIVLEAQDMMNNPSIYPNPDRFNCSSCQFKAPCTIREEAGDWEWYLNNSGLYAKRQSN